ncbi:MAG: amidohydrolase family protein [Proteobacteria bacterium]|nr:amidohydrolase family protein [Pseudomonadota bacterium]
MKHPRKFLLATLALLVLPLAQATAAGVVALVGGRLIDGFGGPPIDRSVILVEGERIKAVGTVDSLPVPPGAQVISTAGMSVLPGLWDAHVHTYLLGHSNYTHWDETYGSNPRLAKEIMPAAAHQLLLAGVTSARDLGAPLEAVLSVRDRINRGEIPGPTLYVSGPFIQHAPYPGTEVFRWGVSGAADARAKVKKLASAGVDIIKLIDQDQMTEDEVKAVVEEAHAHHLPVVAHAHRPDEIRRGLKYNVDCFEHIGLATSPGYPDDIQALLADRTARGNLGPLFWTPTISVLYNYEYLRDNPLQLGDPAWRRDVPPDIVADILDSVRHPGQLGYFQITPLRRPTLETKFHQLQKAGVVMLIGTDSGIPMAFHSGSTWRELDTWVNHLGVDPMTAIRAATYWPAVQMKVDKDYGSVSEGKYADIIAVQGDVLRFIDLLQRVDVVIKHGARVK